ncbi:MAG: hypothetical protein DCC55_27460 [Chloroflexi bacterium]|nr:MAG: hypothetical protein DCC55_27460 [Chloroflexota bacterium]
MGHGFVSSLRKTGSLDPGLAVALRLRAGASARLVVAARLQARSEPMIDENPARFRPLGKNGTARSCERLLGG